MPLIDVMWEKAVRELGVLLDHAKHLLAEPLDAFSQGLRQLPDVLLHKVAELFALVVGMKPVLLLHHRFRESLDPPREGP